MRTGLRSLLCEGGSGGGRVHCKKVTHDVCDTMTVLQKRRCKEQLKVITARDLAQKNINNYCNLINVLSFYWSLNCTAFS